MLIRLAVAAAAASCLLGVAPVAAGSDLGKSALASPNLAGYEAHDHVAITTFTGTITVPTSLRCPARGPRNVNAEVQMFDRVSDDSASLGWNAGCNNGVLTYSQSTAVMNKYERPKFSTAQGEVPAAPGQTLSFTMTVSASGVSGSVKNLSTGSSASLLFPMTKPPSFTGIEVEMAFYNASSPRNVSPIPSFTAVTFGNLKFNGLTLAGLHPIAQEMVNGGRLQAVMGPISPAGTFKAIFKHV